MILTIAAAAAAVVLAASALSKPAPPANTPIGYAQQLAAQQGWVGIEWQDLYTMVNGESGWNPCAVYPSRVVCNYYGSNSCGIPQATPCPSAWQGHLATTWRTQVQWLISYVKRRYGRPSVALAYHYAHGSY